MKKRILTALVIAAVLAGGCAEEPPPPSVDEFLTNKILLDATMVRCTRNRAEMRHTAECVNAFDAANELAREEEAERRKLLEQQSERKRAALRRAQEAAEQARRRAEEARRAREEAAYLAQFESTGETVSGDGDASAPLESTTAPAAPAAGTVSPASEGNADAVDGDAPQGSDLQAIREELERRQQAADPR